MFPDEWATLGDLLWLNVKSLAAHPVVMGVMVIVLALEFTPFLVKAMLSLTGRNRVLGPREKSRDPWEDHDDLWEQDEGYRRDYRDFRHGRNQRRWEGYYDPAEWHDV